MVEAGAMYYQAQNYWYPNCCLTSPRVNRFTAEGHGDTVLLEFRPRFGNGFLSADSAMSYGFTGEETYPARILDATFSTWRELEVQVDVGGLPLFRSVDMEAEGTLVDGRLDIREIMRLAGEELGASAGALILQVDKTYSGGGSPDAVYLVLKWEAI